MTTLFSSAKIHAISHVRLIDATKGARHQYLIGEKVHELMPIQTKTGPSSETVGNFQEKFDIALYSLLAKFESLIHGISALEALYRAFTELHFRESSEYS